MWSFPAGRFPRPLVTWSSECREDCLASWKWVCMPVHFFCRGSLSEYQDCQVPAEKWSWTGLGPKILTLIFYNSLWIICEIITDSTCYPEAGILYKSILPCMWKINLWKYVFPSSSSHTECYTWVYKAISRTNKESVLVVVGSAMTLASHGHSLSHVRGLNQGLWPICTHM